MKRRELVANATAIATGIAALSPALGMAASDDKLVKQDAPWPLRGSEAFEIASEAVGDSFAVGVWQPEERVLALTGRTAEVGQPMDLVYVLDGSWALGMAAAMCTLQLVDLINPGFPRLLLVGVDYPVGAVNSRSRDYTMVDSAPKAMAEGLAASPKTATGGADNFLRFLEEELDPLIRSRYNTTGKPAGILGDSFGGTFTFYAFLKQSKLFDRYWLGSPGIFTTSTDYLTKFRETLAAPLVQDTKMFLSLGSMEANGGIDFYEDMGRSFNSMVSALKTKPNAQLKWQHQVYPGKTHTSVLAPAMSDALLYLYGPNQG
jgi:predicted alpha/beta superfamily hydrolase